MAELAELALRFVVIGALAFGGGQAALPLVERVAVAQTGWLSATDFSAGVGLAYATPGPVLILAAFIGFRVSGVAGAVVATFAVFAIPVLLAAGAARVVGRLSGSVRFRAAGRYGAAAAIGLLGVTIVALSRPLIEHEPVLIAASAATLLAAVRGVPPLLLLAFGVVLGAIVGTFGGA